MPSGTREPERWPDDPRARKAIADYLGERAEPGSTEPLAGFELDFRGAVLDGMALDCAWFNGARLDGVRLRRADLFGAQLPGASLRQADLTGALLRKAVLDYADAQGAVLDEAELHRAELFRTDLRGASLRRTTWDGALLSCDLTGADLTEAVFDQTSTRGGRLAGAIVTGARGSLFGPVDVGRRGESLELGGDALAQWFRERGAAQITVLNGRV